MFLLGVPVTVALTGLLLRAASFGGPFHFERDTR